jgi:uncharacterized repeat protein (TIGR03803 family)
MHAPVTLTYCVRAASDDAATRNRKGEKLMAKSSIKHLISAYVGLILLLAIPGALPKAQAQTFRTLHRFTGTPDGARPFQTNLLDVNGTLYGTTYGGGTFGSGTVFKLNLQGQETVLYSFTGGTDGAGPNAGLVRDTAGNLYSTTQNGGDLSCVFTGLPAGCGVVYKLDTTGTQSVLYSFTGGTDGTLPQGLVIDSGGNLYGETFFGGSQTCFGGVGCGVVFKVDSSGNETPLYSFEDGADGAVPYGFVTRDSAGNLYGSTTQGGDFSSCSGAGCGVVFKVDASGNETVLYTFTGGADGAVATGGLLIDATGNVYGTTAGGGDLTCVGSPSNVGCGVVFEVTAAGTESVLYTFTGVDGATPALGLVRDSRGNIYSTTEYGGAFNLGTVFELTPNGVESVLHSFTGLADGELPLSGLVMDAKGNLYSNTSQGGDLSCSPPSGCGTVFKLTPTLLTSTTTTLSSSANPSIQGQTVTFTATVTSTSGAPPNGESVSFMQGKTLLGTGTLNNGTAIFTTSTLLIGTHSITAVYAGDSTLAGSASKAVKQVVLK